MKKIKNLFFMLAAFVAINCVISCSNNLVGGYVEEQGASTNSLIITGLDGGFSGARTLFPGKFKENELTFKLSGERTNGGTGYPETTLVVANGAAKVDLAPVKWNLTLTAYKTINGAETAVLQGKSFADLTNGGETISFLLKPYGTANGSVIFGKGTGSGDYEVSYVSTDAEIKSYTIGLYDRVTDEAVPGTEEVVTVSAGSEKTGTIYKAWTDVPAGEYNLKVIFIGGTDGKTVINHYPEIVNVVGGTTSQRKEALTIDNFLAKPNAPENFKVALVSPVADNDKKEDEYKVKFTWTDKAINEAGFILSIKEVDDTGVEVSDSVYSHDYKASDINSVLSFVDGSLAPNSETATIELPTGHLFKATIRATNAVGDSAEVLATSDDFTKKVTVGAEELSLIGRYQVSYDLNGGTLKMSASESYAGTYYLHETYADASEITLLTLKEYDSADLKYPTAYRKTDAKTTTTIINKADNSTYTETVYSGYENLELKLSFTTPVIITILEYQEISKNRIKLEFKGTGDADFSDLTKISGMGTIKVTVDGTKSEKKADGTYEATDVYQDGKNITSFDVEYGTTTNTSMNTTKTITLSDNAGTREGNVEISLDDISDDTALMLKVNAKDVSSGLTYSITTYIPYVK